jgi:hypothetical protein
LTFGNLSTVAAFNNPYPGNSKGDSNAVKVIRLNDVVIENMDGIIKI